ncbi:uncharacterized protein LOC115449217 isoform X2 [Manduca sexta]|nr:uncharacterized protein LOC115449217 isoform X2 [Manduca sexta]
MFENFTINGKVTILPTGKKILRDEALPTIEHQFVPAIELQTGVIYIPQKSNPDDNQTEEVKQNQIPDNEQQELLIVQEVSNNLIDIEHTEHNSKEPLLNQARNDLHNNKDTEVKTQSVENFWDNIQKSLMLPQFWLYVKKPNGLEFIRTDPMTGQIKNHLRLNEDTSITVILRNNEELNLKDKITPLNSIHDYLKSVERWPLCVGTQIENNKYSKLCKGVIIGDEAYKRNQLNARCKSCRILRHRLQNRKSTSKILGKTPKGCPHLFKQCKHLKRMDNNQSLPKSINSARTSLATSSSKKDLAEVINKNPFINLDNKPAAKTQVNDKRRSEIQTTQLNLGHEFRSDNDSAVLPVVPAEESVVPGPKNFSWQKPNEVVHILADDVETEAAANSLSMYWEDEEASLLSEQLDGNPKGREVFRCNVCDVAIVGFRYTCVQCSDLDLCGACEADGAHHQHYVLRVPADKHTAEVQLVVATIQRHLMRKLDPTSQHDQNQSDVISLKSEVKSEAEDYDNDSNCDDYNDDTKNEAPKDVMKGSSSSGPQTEDFDRQAHNVDSGDAATRGECGEGRQGVSVESQENPKITKIYLKMADFMKMKERGLPWVQILNSNKTSSVDMADAQPSINEAIVLSETVTTDLRQKVPHAGAQSQLNTTIVLQQNQQMDLQTTIMKEKDRNEDPLSRVNIKNIQNNLIYSGQLDSMNTKIIVTDAKPDVAPGIQLEATVREGQSNICLPEANYAKPQCPIKLKRLQSQVLGNAGKKR